MNKILRIPIVLFFLITGYLNTQAQTQFWSDNFEDSGAPSAGSRTLSIAEKNCSNAHYFLRTDGTNISIQSGAYSSYQGSKFFAFEDIDYLPSCVNNTGSPAQTITWSGISISGKTGLSFKGLFGANSVSFQDQATFPSNYDYMEIYYRIDGGSWNKIIGIYAHSPIVVNGVSNITPLAQDTNGDLIGDGAYLTYAMSELSANIPGTGSTLDLRFNISNNATVQEMAIDDFRLFSSSSASPLSASISSQTNVSCNGGTNGAATVTASGGTTPYSYAWAPSGGIAATATGLTSGTYTVTVTDNVAATTTATVTINQPTAITSSVSSQTNVSCNGGSNGSATITASGGTGTKTYSWAPSGGTAATATGLTAQVYTVTITDANSCSKIQTVNISQPTAITSSVSSQTNVSCNGGTNGSATITASGGTGTKTYSWAPSGGTAATATGLSAQVYTVTITDANSCSKIQTVNISQPTAITSSITSQTNVSVYGGSDGSATITASGGTGTKTYSWAPSGGTAATATGLTAGIYTVTITDANSCSKIQTVNISQPAAPSLSASISSQTDVSCNGGTNGAATVTASGGTGPYTYAWAPSGGIAATATGLTSGTYTVTVTDNVAATTTATVTINQPTAITSSVSSQTNVSCNGGSNGSATITASGGTGTLTYSWAPSGGTAATATGLSAQIYTVTITDANSCSKIQTVNISQPTAITSSVSSQTNVSCNGGSNGSATITASGGTGTLTYSWAPSGGTAATATGLTAQVYTVTITDANSCSKIQTVNISQPTAITSSVSSQTNVSCNGGSNGSATITASGGTGTKTYSWAPSGGTAATATGLAAGIYTVTITDANSCSKIQTVNISQPTAITSSVSSQTNVSCNGGSNGSATITASGGTGTLTYSWAPSGGTAATATGLTAQVYTVTITDANSCSKIQTVNISQPTAITSSVSSQTNVSCNGGTNGSATITASGGTGTKTYSWAPSGGTAATATGLAAGIYTVTITDANTCSKVQTVAITQPTAITATSSQTDVSTYGGSNGSATVTVSGGTGAYTYSWAPSGGTAATATGLVAGTYTVTITDANNCMITKSFTITQPLATTVTSIKRVNSDPANGSTVNYEITFAAPVTGVSSSNFSLSAPGLSGASINPTLTGSGKVYNVKVNTGTGGGTLALNLDNSTGITPAVTNVPFTSGEVYIIDKIAPAVSIGAPSASSTNGGPVSYTITYTDDHFNSSTLSSSDITVNSTGTAAAGNVSVSGSGLTRTVELSGITGNGTLGISLAAATATDQAGNSAPASGPSATFAVDNTKPTVSISNPSIASINTGSGPVTYTVTYADANFNAATLTASDVTLNATGTAGASVGVSGSGKTYTVTVSNITGIGSLGISLAAGTASDQVGNQAPAAGPSATFEVTRIDQHITFNAISAKTYGDADFNPGATSDNNGTAITYTSDNTAVATIIAGKIHIVGVGTSVITASQAQDATHSAATNQQQTLTVNQKSLTVTLNAAPVITKVYNGTIEASLAADNYTLNGVIGTDALTITGTASYDNANAGTGKTVTASSFILSGDKKDNYILSTVSATTTGNITASPLAVTADVQSKTYGDADPALTYQITTGTLVSGESFTGSLTRDAGENVGSYVIKQGSLTAGSNYSISYTGNNLVIGQKTIAVTADAQSKIYGDADPALTYKITSGTLVGTDAFTGSLTRNAGENIGDYAIKQGTLALSSNYALTYAGADLSITKKAIAVTADAQNKIYGDADPALTYKITTGDLIGTDVFTGSLTRDAGEAVGSYAIKQGTLALSNNYTLTYAGANLAIGKKAVTVTADVQNKTYGDADPALTYKITTGNLVGSDAFTGSLTRDAGEAVGSYAVKQGTLALSNNYTLTYAGANLAIGKKAVTVTADAQSKTYGDADPGLTYKITTGNLVGTDAFTGSLTRNAGEDVGNYAIKQGTLTLGNNYTLNYTGANLIIGKKAIAVTSAAKSKIYGTVDPALTYTFTPALISGDAFSGSLTRDAGESVGSYAIKQGTLALSSNYTLNYTGASLTITNATLMVTVQNQSKVYGSANPALTVSYSGFVNGDTQAGLTSKATASTTATTTSVVGTYPITASGAAMPGYTIAYVPGTLTITKAIVNVTAEDKSRNYGLANPSLTVTYSGFVNGDTPASLTKQATASTNATITSAPGKYAIIASGATSANYNFTYSSGTLTVIPLTNSVMADLKISSGILSPVFSGTVYQYAVSVTYATDQVTFTPTVDATATISINGQSTANSVASAPVLLNPGDNKINIVVTAQDGSTKQTYVVNVHRALPPAAIVPTNVLSPNGDGKNDTWFIKDIELYPNNKVTVYDRAGREIYSKRGYDNDWNGTLRGAPLTQGTYYYIIDLGPGYETLKGFITILKNNN